ncbi:non-lysosomal glucosylceramidase isoform X2 [Plodia interpunctella]|nr:non-lysosomal glucosylceramidase isoform X2 [Plodia interpunctella]XP_053613199.1 non-lysosomal glucosylceramidase isoform X2 [Plodia interpunctella]
MEIETVGDQGPALDRPPDLGLKLPLNHEYPLQTKQNIKIRANQVVEMVPLTTRYLKYYMGRRLHKKKPIMDMVHMVSAQRMYGCPIGGIGGGTIGRGFKGEFCRFQLFPGIYEYVTIPECQFIVNIRNAAKESIFQSVLSTYDKPKKAPASWEWNLNPADCEYTALYPRAWTTYDLSNYGIKLVCRQISPVIPHNYKDSSLPCAVFVFSAQNVCNEHRDVSITFTWTEVLTGPNKKKSIAKLELERYSEDHTCGVTLEQKIADTPCTFTIAKRKDQRETIHEGYCLWNSSKTSSYLWDCLQTKGKLEPDPSLTPPPPVMNEKGRSEAETKEKHKKIHKCDSMGLSSVISLDPGGIGTTEFCLSWDMPVIKYKKHKKVHKRYYTKYFGSDGIAGASIAAYALRNYKNWEKQLAEWQDPIFTNSNIPDWLKSALMNELYFIADGGTIWFDGHDEYPESDPRHDFGLFGYLEGHEYRMYNTYDVHFYASFALAQLWPNLQAVLQYMFRDTITQESEKSRPSLYNGKTVKFKIKDSIPHDLGDPEGVPFSNINAYNIHDVSEWRDLNLKFILQVLRDYRLLRGHSAPFGNKRYRSIAFIDDVRDAGDQLPSRPASALTDGSPVVHVETTYAVGDILDLLYRNTSGETEGAGERSEAHAGGGAGAGGAAWDADRYLADLYGACVTLLRRARQWDRDGDGLIENGGFPDQTYDAWVMLGPSAYCGGLWVASICAVKNMAQILGHEADAVEFGNMLDQAQRAYEEKLWNGSYYRFDVRERSKNTIMADQLAGHWYLRASGLHESIFPATNVKKALATIYDNNVLKFNEGRMGAVNGYIANGDKGHIDTTAIQSEESWTGTTFGLAAVMIYEGMREEAFVTAGGLYKTMSQMGLAFETPEALNVDGNHRSIAYMRPLAIWAIYQALVAVPPPRTMANGQVHNTKDNQL